jgi:hypothetical protein
MENIRHNEYKPPEQHQTNKGGRPKNGSIPDKELLEKRLRRIWIKLGNPPAAVISAASLYAELKGWKLKKPEISENGEVMKIEFADDKVKSIEKNLVKPPKNKMMEVIPVTKIEVVTETSTTTTPAPIQGPPKEEVKVEFTI